MVVGEFTMIVTVAVTVCPALFDTVSVYVVVAVGLTSTDNPLGTAPTP